MAKKPVWREFTTFTKLKDEIRTIINARGFEESFRSELISDLIAERHYFCSKNGLRPLKFKKTRENQPYRFYGYFENEGWHAVSWAKCASGQNLNFRKEIESALRLEIVPEKTAYRKQHPTCERCGVAPSEEVHHANPSWKDLMGEVMSSLSDEEIREEVAHWNWFSEEEFRVDQEKAIFPLFQKRHKSARLEALCRPCHASINIR